MHRQTEGQKEEWTEGWKDGQTLFHRTLPSTARGPIKVNDLLGTIKSRSFWTINLFKKN